MSYLETGLSAIRATQVALQTISNNIANADTEGYHRQRVDLETRRPYNLAGVVIGRGVDVSGVRQIIDLGVETSITSYRSLTADAQARYGTWQRIESIMTPGSGSLDTKVASLFDSLEQLAARPAESFLRSQLVESGRALTGIVNRLSNDLNQLATGLERELRAGVDEVNRLTDELATLDTRIRIEQAQGRDPNDLYDRRGILVNELSALVGVDARSLDVRVGPPVAANGWLIVSEGVDQMQVVPTSDGGVEVQTDSRVGLTTGRLAGLLSSLDDVRAARDELVGWFQGFRAEFDHLQATGLGLDGPFGSVQSTRTFQDATGTLSELDLPFSVSSGNLYVTVTDTATQARTTHRVAIDVNADTLADVVARLDALPNVNAFLDPSTGRVTIAGGTRHALDFSGRLDQQPATSTITGTATPQIGGLYTGDKNTRWSVTAIDTGTVGVTSPLRLEIRDVATNALLGTVDAGSGYVAGSPLELGEGVTLSFDAGTLNAGDVLTVEPVADPDEVRLLSALGIRSFFTGAGPGQFDVNPDLVRNPQAIATSRTGLAGDITHLNRLIALRDERLYDGAETIEERLATMVSTIGVRVLQAESEAEQLGEVDARLRADRDAVSGVDVNEEMLAMLKYQQAFQAAARFVTSVDKTIQELMNIVG
jgi:flagellar hook-associated protein 1 FlgK